MDQTKASHEVVRTDSIAAEQTAVLTSILDLVFEAIDQVAGGECSCPGCCSHSLRVAVQSPA